MRNIELSLESGDDLDVRHFNVLQAMSSAFHVDLIARSHDDALDLSRVIGKGAAFRLHGEGGGAAFTGVVSEMAQSAVEPEGLSTYTLQVVPRLWLLGQRSGHRLFQHLSVPEIVQKILAEWRIQPALQLSQPHPKLAMRTQYGESDYDFVRRLLAEAGISFFFRTVEGEDTKLVLSDAPETGEPRAAGPVPFLADASLARGAPHVSGVDVAAKVVPARSTVRDHDFRRPRYALSGSHATEGGAGSLLEDYRYLQGHSLAEGSGGGEPVADMQGAYRHLDDQASLRARRTSEAHQAAGARVAFHTSLLDLAPGTVFSVTGHPHPELAGGKKLLVTDAWINGDAGAGGWHAGGTATPAGRPFRPALAVTTRGAGAASCGPFEPVKTLAKPRIHGVQSAVVTGPAGEDVHTDEHGRVKVQFPWDREGQFDEKSSPWIRVSQAWAGAGSGLTAVPRVGQEVLVGYHDGDPDHPVVVGRLHNATAPVPYALPEHKARTSLRSSSDAGANEITFDDKTGGELFYVHAQRDLHKIVAHDELEHTQGNRHVHVDGDLTLSAKGRVILHSGHDLVVKGGPNVKLNPSETPQEAKKPAALPAKAPPKKKPSTAAAENARLAHMHTGPMPASDETAKLRKKLAEKYQADAEKLGKQFHIPPALILALMSRESGFGTLLDASGRGDFGHGFGILQVDDRSHVPVGGPYSLQHMQQAMGIFDGGLAQIKRDHPGWTPDQQLAGAVAAYNAGPNAIATQPTNPSTWAQMDVGTTGNNYSRDTWAQAQWFANNLHW
jgi:type VI secretion system secreted protein VgrG